MPTGISQISHISQTSTTPQMEMDSARTTSRSSGNSGHSGSDDYPLSQGSKGSTATTATNDSKTKRKNPKNHVGPWRLGRTLGRGSTGRVRLAKHSETGQLAAVKIVLKSKFLKDSTSSRARSQTHSHAVKEQKSKDAEVDSAGLPYGIEREIIIMKLINHPNVMSLYDVWENKGELYLVLEYIAGGELFDYLIRNGRLDEKEAIYYFTQIVQGVDYCHRFGICHRDLKPENLLLDKNNNIKIADFGMAALETNDKMLETSCGSPHYASPEIVAGKSYHGAPSDIWSCGIILFALLTAHLPFDDTNIRNLLLKVQNGKFNMPKYLSPEAKDLIWRMLRIDPEIRITMTEILSHPLLNKYPSIKTSSSCPPIPKSVIENPVKSRDEIDFEILNNLKTLWHGIDQEEIINKLLSKGSNSEKGFYCLLRKYKHDHMNDNIPSTSSSTVVDETQLKLQQLEDSKPKVVEQQSTPKRRKNTKSKRYTNTIPRSTSQSKHHNRTVSRSTSQTKSLSKSNLIHENGHLKTSSRSSRTSITVASPHRRGVSFSKVKKNINSHSRNTSINDFISHSTSITSRLTTGSNIYIIHDDDEPIKPPSLPKHLLEMVNNGKFTNNSEVAPLSNGWEWLTPTPNLESNGIENDEINDWAKNILENAFEFDDIKPNDIKSETKPKPKPILKENKEKKQKEQEQEKKLQLEESKILEVKPHKSYGDLFDSTPTQPPPTKPTTPNPVIEIEIKSKDENHHRTRALTETLPSIRNFTPSLDPNNFTNDNSRILSYPNSFDLGKDLNFKFELLQSELQLHDKNNKNKNKNKNNNNNGTFLFDFEKYKLQNGNLLKPSPISNVTPKSKVIKSKTRFDDIIDNHSIINKKTSLSLRPTSDSIGLGLKFNNLNNNNNNNKKNGKRFDDAVEDSIINNKTSLSLRPTADSFGLGFTLDDLNTTNDNNGELFDDAIEIEESKTSIDDTRKQFQTPQQNNTGGGSTRITPTYTNNTSTSLNTGADLFDNSRDSASTNATYLTTNSLYPFKNTATTTDENESFSLKGKSRNPSLGSNDYDFEFDKNMISESNLKMSTLFDDFNISKHENLNLNDDINKNIIDSALKSTVQNKNLMKLNSNINEVKMKKSNIYNEIKPSPQIITNANKDEHEYDHEVGKTEKKIRPRVSHMFKKFSLTPKHETTREPKESKEYNNKGRQRSHTNMTMSTTATTESVGINNRISTFTIGSFVPDSSINTIHVDNKPIGQNWFKKILNKNNNSSNVNEEFKEINTTLESFKLHELLGERLKMWQSHGMKNIKVYDNIIEASISRTNIFELKSVRFKIRVEHLQKNNKNIGSVAIFSKEKGSRRSFETFVREIEKYIGEHGKLI